MQENTLYKHFEIFQKLSESTAKRYCCFEILRKKRFCVQSCDYIHLPIDEVQLKNLEKQKYELFIQSLPDERSELFPSIEEAILQFDNDFS